MTDRTHGKMVSTQRLWDEAPPCHIRAALRRLALETGGTCPVVVVAGDGAPRVRGAGFYHTTPYHPSTVRVEVGEALAGGFIGRSDNRYQAG